MSIAIIFLIVALILFAAATFNAQVPFNLVAAGLAFVVAAQLVGAHAL